MKEKEDIKFGYFVNKNGDLEIKLKNHSIHNGIFYLIEVIDERVVLSLKHENPYWGLGYYIPIHLNGETDLSLIKRINKVFFPFMYGNEELPEKEIIINLEKQGKNSIEFLLDEISEEIKRIIELFKKDFLCVGEMRRKEKIEKIREEIQELLYIVISNFDNNLRV